MIEEQPKRRGIDSFPTVAMITKCLKELFSWRKAEKRRERKMVLCQRGGSPAT